MNFSLTQDYPTDLARLWAALGRREYVEQKYRSFGATAIRMLKFEVTGEMIEVELERSALVVREKMPAWAQPFVGRAQMMRHHTRWQRISPTHIDAELDIAPVGRPVHAHGVGTVIELTPVLTQMTLRFDVNCSIPALGDKVARLFADQVKEALRADHAFTRGYLAESRNLASPSAPIGQCD